MTETTATRRRDPRVTATPEIPERPAESKTERRELRAKKETDLGPLQLDLNLSVASEAGETAIWNPLDKQLSCIDAVLIRRVISSQGLSLPSYVATSELSYVVQGTGIQGAILSGCSETRERLNVGDFVALPTGTINWIYNDGPEPLVLISFRQGISKIHSLGGTSRLPNSINWLLQRYAANNIFAGFDEETLENIYKVDKVIVSKMQGQGDCRGQTVHVLDPSTMEQRDERRQQFWRQQQHRPSNNVCNITFHIKGENPTNILVKNEGGTIYAVNGTHYPILKRLQLSGTTGYDNNNTFAGLAMNPDAYSIIYGIRGNGRVQIVGNSPTPAYDGQLREGEMILLPQGCTTTTQGGKDGFKWVVFKTNSDPTLLFFSGRTSVMRGLSTGVLMNMYRINKDQVEDLKGNWTESGLYPPSRA
ncbi:hypothetical protein Syun_030024 [Stephania yunnanensis]|uniref:Cupin type-1 domain-containing protein n=1 Tax=Stephania yunnanensis TaxID=152371 RepID=A0AAP0HLX3_9MAGN